MMTRAEECAAAWVHYPGKNTTGAAAITTRAGTARIGHIEADGTLLLVWAGPRHGPPTWRIANPPLTTAAGRLDPVLALAETIAAPEEAR